MVWSFIIPLLPPAEIRWTYLPAAGAMVEIARGLVFDIIASSPDIQLENWLA